MDVNVAYVLSTKHTHTPSALRVCVCECESERVRRGVKGNFTSVLGGGCWRGMENILHMRAQNQPALFLTSTLGLVGRATACFGSGALKRCRFGFH